MPNQKIVFKYVQYTEDWEELFYGQFDSINLAMAGMDAGLRASAVLFRQSSCYLSSIRIQDVAQPRSALTKDFIIPVTGLGADRPDMHNTCAVWALRSANAVSQRHILLRGLKDDDTIRSAGTGEDDPSPALYNGVKGYIANMTRVGLRIRSLVPINYVDPYDWYDIRQVVVAPSGTVTLSTYGTVPLVAGGRIILSQMDPKDWPGMNGHYRTRGVAAPDFKINYKSHAPPGTYPVSKGRYRVEDYRYLIISPQDPDGQSDFVRFSSRLTKSGPFGLRGAKKAVRLRSR